jgi:hypothetical protein
MPTPFADFENNFRSAETLLKVYRLLDTPDGPQTQHAMMQHVRELLMARDDEEIILLVNELFMGAVRENADVRPAVFKRDSLSMLLRQSVVAACSAIDVYYPALLKEHLPQVIAVKQRNFIPTDKSTRDFLRDFSLSLEQSLRLLSDPKPESILSDFLVEALKRKTLSNRQGVSFALQILGIDEPWHRIADRLGQPKEALAGQFEALVSRRNDIVHRGDRSPKDPNGQIQAIVYSWTESHVRAVRSIVLASKELAEEQMAALATPVQPDPVVFDG